MLRENCNLQSSFYPWANEFTKADSLFCAVPVILPLLLPGTRANRADTTGTTQTFFYQR